MKTKLSDLRVGMKVICINNTLCNTKGKTYKILDIQMKQIWITTDESKGFILISNFDFYFKLKQRGVYL